MRIEMANRIKKQPVLRREVAMWSSTSDRRKKRGARGRILVAAAALWACGTAARAADLAPPPPAPAAYNWTSIYIGVNGGYAGGMLNETVSDGSGRVQENLVRRAEPAVARSPLAAAMPAALRRSPQFRAPHRVPQAWRTRAARPSPERLTKPESGAQHAEKALILICSNVNERISLAAVPGGAKDADAVPHRNLTASHFAGNESRYPQ